MAIRGTVRVRLKKNWDHIITLKNGMTLRVNAVTEKGSMCIDIYDADTNAPIQRILPGASNNTRQTLTKPPE